MPSPTHCPVGCHRRESGYQIDRRATTERRPPAKEHSRLLSGRIYLFGAFDIVGFSAPSLPSTPSCLPQSSPAVRRPSGIPGRRNIKSISERRYLSSRNYRGIYGPVSFVNCTRWAGPRRSAKKVSLASSCDGQAIFISLSGVSGDAVGRSLGLRFVDLRKAQEFISGSSLPLSSERSLARAQ